MLTVHVRRCNEPAGLLGGAYEFEPFIASWGTWGKCRRATRAMGLATDKDLCIARLPLPACDPAQLRGDDALWIKQLAHTLPSGVDALDAANADKKIVREIAAGSTRLPLAALLEAATRKQSITCPVIHSPLYNEYTTELLTLEQAGLFDGTAWDANTRNECALLVAYKGQLQVTATLEQGSAAEAAALLQALRAAARTERAGQRLMYNSELMQREHGKALNAAVDSYVSDFVGADKQAPAYPLGAEQTLEHLHVPYYVSEFGPLPLGAMLQHRIEDRRGATPEERAFYAPDKNSALFINEQLRSACQRVGVAPDAFVRDIRAQLAQAPSDAAQRPGLLRALDVVGEMGTFIANRANYTADQGYPNAGAVALVEHIQAATEALGSGKKEEARVHAQAIAAALRHEEVARVTGRIHSQLRAHRVPFGLLARAAQAGTTGWRARSLRLAAGGGKDEKAPTLAHECELMDPQPALGTCFDDDCDAVAGTAADACRLLGRLAQVAPEAEAPLVHAAAALMDRYYVFTGIASVCGGYVDNNGVDLSTEERRKLKDLPMIGDELDRRTKPGGHAVGVLVPRAVVADGFARAGNHEAAALVTGARPVAAWERRAAVYLLEGTGSSDGFVLPMGEVAEVALRDKAAALTLQHEAATRKRFLKGLVEAGPEKSALVKHANLEGLSFYAEKQDPRRRVSTFYLGMGLLSSPDLAKLDPRLGALALVNVKARTRGAEIGSFLRMPFDGAKSEVGLVPMYARLSRAQWEQCIAPVVEAIQNQMPLARTEFLGESAEEAKLACLRVGQVVPPSVVLAAPSIPELTLERTLDQHALAAIGRPMQIGGNGNDGPPSGYTIVIAVGLETTIEDKYWVLLGPNQDPRRTTNIVVENKEFPRMAYGASQANPYLIYVRSLGVFFTVSAATGAVNMAGSTRKYVDRMYFQLRYWDYIPNRRPDRKPMLAANAAKAPVTVQPTTPLCFYLDAHKAGEPDTMRDIFAELDARKAKGEIAGYTLTRDKPLVGASEVFTVTVSLPVV